MMRFRHSIQTAQVSTQHFVWIATLTLAVQTACSQATAASSARQAKQTKQTKRFVEHVVREIEGWQVHLDPRLLRGKHEKLGRSALRILANQLYEIKRVLPAEKVKKLQRVPVWMDLDHRLGSLQYHPSGQWLKDHGDDPRMAKAVHIPNAGRFVTHQRTNHQPWAVLHELSHAYHDRELGFDDELIKQAYQHALRDKRYESVLHISGKMKRHYALTNHKEYFAEMSEAFFGTNDFYPFVRAELEQCDPETYQLLTEIWMTHVTAPPQPVRKAFRLDPFYKKYVSAIGLPVVSSEKVLDAALLEAAYLINRMLAGRDDIRQAMIRNRVRFAVMSTTELTTDIPEHSDLEPKNYWDRRARGLGATPQRRAVSCGEENLLGCPGDPYSTENILIHEFAHAIHHMGLDSIDKNFDPNLKSIYDQAVKEGLWKGKYAASNRAEYWAEGVQSYFGTNRPPDHDHNHVDTREELAEYDPRLFQLIDRVFQGNPWQYQRPEKRLRQVHLKQIDRSKLPRFTWPQRLAEESAKLEALKKAKLKSAQEPSSR